MKTLLTILAISIIATLSFCTKEENEVVASSQLKLWSSEIGIDSLLPMDYTCDGTSSTLPIQWSGVPDKTVSLVLIMHHEASPTDIHYYWILYNIPSTTTSLPKNVQGIGSLGTNSVNDLNQYAPPCSQGPGEKDYTLTLYALSANVEFTNANEPITRDAMLDAIKNITISSTKMVVTYSRIIY